MNRHVNFLGTSVWVSSDSETVSSRRFRLALKPTYSPLTLAAYSVFAGFLVAVALYGMNLSRRGYVWTGRLLTVASSVVPALSLLLPYSENASSFFWLGLFNGIVAVHLYKLETPYFRQVMRNGGRRARWWLPLIFAIPVGLRLWSF